MKWINHRMVTGAMVYAVTENLVWTAAAIVGSVWPDKSEGMPNKRGWQKRHRGISHWPLLYAALMLFVWLMPFNLVLDENFNLRLLLLFFFLGALMHIAEDALCGKVPVLTPKRKHGLRFFYVGTAREYVFSVGIIVAVYLIKFNIR